MPSYLHNPVCSFQSFIASQTFVVQASWYTHVLYIFSVYNSISRVFLRCFRDPIRVPRISENYHRFPRIREIGSVHVHTGHLKFSLKKTGISCIFYNTYRYQTVSGVTRRLSLGGKLWRGPTTQHSEKSWEMIIANLDVDVSTAKKQKHPENLFRLEQTTESLPQGLLVSKV